MLESLHHVKVVSVQYKDSVHLHEIGLLYIVLLVYRLYYYFSNVYTLFHAVIYCPLDFTGI